MGSTEVRGVHYFCIDFGSPRGPVSGLGRNRRAAFSGLCEISYTFIRN
jgi:hypothetical protein